MQRSVNWIAAHEVIKRMRAAFCVFIRIVYNGNVDKRCRLDLGRSRRCNWSLFYGILEVSGFIVKKRDVHADAKINKGIMKWNF